jgi:3-deoxy-D-manno-octulosonate 8-phosphate phosphatase (KDO 8-P phosphatase)
MRKVSLIVYDFDGVLTDNRVWVSEDGKESVACNRSDGWWMKEIRALGVDQVILSTEANPVVSMRGKKLNIPVFQNVPDKRAGLLKIAEERKVPLSEIAYVGNEMNDKGCFEIAGFTLCPEDAHPKIRSLAQVILPAKGGAGIVPHLFEWLMAE